MKLFVQSAIGLFLLASVVLAENTPAALKTQMSAMLSDLQNTRAADGSPKSAEVQAKEMEAFIKKYADPADLESITKTTPLSELAEDFIIRGRAQLAKVIQAVANDAPIRSADGLEYRFEIKDPAVSSKKEIIFRYDAKGDMFHVQN